MRTVEQIEADRRKAEDNDHFVKAIQYNRELVQVEQEVAIWWSQLPLSRKQEICEAERAPDEWECMNNAYGELEGFMHKKCGHQSQSATHYCSNCGHKMAIAEAEAAPKEGF